MGQGFADEIFRVFCNRHPDVRIEYIDIAPELEVMIKHVQEDADEP
ncbi:MAG: STAS-like domain-containing protein [Candidatus Brocadiia bacterium]